jgi:hypothetical protein
MKTALLPVALLSALFIAACASSNGGFVNDDIHMCAPGDPITIEAGVERQDLGMDPRGINSTEQLMVRVRVTNLTDDEIEVVSIRTEQSSETSAYRIENSYREFKEKIAEGEDHVFEIPSRGQNMTAGAGYVTSRRVELTVAVSLANGDVYRCRFAV